MDGTGSGSGAIGAGRTVVVPVAGRAGIPTGATAVVVNLTEASATATGYLTLYPQLSSRPGTSNLDFVASHVSSVEATVSLGSAGGIVVYNSAGSVNAVLDVVGYYAGTSDSNPESVYNPQSPTRVVDTRHSSAVQPGHYLWVDLTVPQTTGIALNVTVTGPTRAGYLEVWPGSGPQAPQTSALNFVAGQTVANMAITRTAYDTNNGDPSFSVGNFSDGPVNIIVDIVGFYTPLAGGGGSVFKAITPTRVVDTRIGRGLPHPLSGGQSAAAATSAVFGDANTVAMVANATGLDDPLGTYLSVYPADTSFPGTSSLNLASREVRSNMVMTGLSMNSTRSFAEYNSSGTLDTLIDAVGYFDSTTTHTSTTLTSTSSATTYDTALTLTASVAGAPGPPTGQVTFADASNGSILAVEPLVGGVAHLTTAALAPGARNIVVTYSGDSVYSPSTSASLPISVAQLPKTVATAFQNDPRHDGMDTRDTFNPATLHQAWSTNLNSATGTASISYPLIAGGRVFVTVAKGSGEFDLYALDATTGSVDWFSPISSSSGWLGLTYDGGQVFVQNSNGNLTAYDAGTGHANWSTAPGQRQFSAPPTAYDGVLYASGAGSGGTLFALSEATGGLVWSAEVANGDVSSPAVDDSGVYADYAVDLSYGFNLNGTNRWTQTYGGSGGGGATSVLNGSHLYLRGGNLGPGALIVSTATGVSSGSFGGTSMPAFDATNMYLVNGGALQAVDKAGSPAHWSFTGDGAIDTTPVTTNGIVFTGSSNGHLYGIDSSTGAQVWTAVAPGAVSTSDGFGMHTGLAAAGGLLAVPAGGYLTGYTN